MPLTGTVFADAVIATAIAGFGATTLGAVPAYFLRRLDEYFNNALLSFAAGVMLAAAIFFLSMVPVGPPLIWGGAAFWLYDQGQTGWAIFMTIYGLAVISSVDNFVKPLLISRTASLPILLIALGVFGGIIAFGFIGIFLGPVLLALGLVLAEKWTAGLMPPAAGRE